MHCPTCTCARETQPLGKMLGIPPISSLSSTVDPELLELLRVVSAEARYLSATPGYGRQYADLVKKQAHQEYVAEQGECSLRTCKDC